MFLAIHGQRAHAPPRVWQEIAYASALTVAPDQSGVCGVVSCPASRSPDRLRRARRACGLRAGDALPLAGGAGGIHKPRPGWPSGTVKLVIRVTGWGLRDAGEGQSPSLCGVGGARADLGQPRPHPRVIASS
jgi:hypothetical protein